MKKEFPFSAFTISLVLFLLSAVQAVQSGSLISQISVSKSSFNPSQKEEVGLSLHLSEKAKVDVHVYDADWGLVKVLAKAEEFAGGAQTFIWDGKDDQGAVVPDEAYFFTIAATDAQGNQDVYDPVAFSGGVTHDIVDADINEESQTINYQMPEIGRVMIRVGV